MNGQYSTFQEYVDQFRQEVGDTDCDIDAKSIAAWLNRALMEVWQATGLDKLFKYHDTFQLASTNLDGTPATTFYLDGGKDGDIQIGTIKDIYMVRLLNGQACTPCPYELCYEDPLDFYTENPYPEKNLGRNPCKFTIDTIGGKQKILFDAPIPPKMTLDIIYSASHPTITGDNPNQLIKVPKGYQNLYDTLVQIYYYEKASDFSSARALREDSDLDLVQARELLARQKFGLPPRRMRGGLHNG